MLEKPLITIDKFGLMGDGGAFYSEGMAVRNNGSQLDEEYDAAEDFYAGQSGFSSVGIIRKVLNVPSYNGSSGYNIILDNQGRLFIYDSLGVGIVTNKHISTIVGYSQFPDMALLYDGNIIVSNQSSLGLLVRGACKTGSGNTSIVDTDGRNFATYGVSISSPNNKVVNLKTGEEFTITGITTTTSTNDTLTFSAGSNTNTANDEFMVIVGTAKGTINGDAATDFDLSDDITFFKGQITESQFKRQIVEYDDGFYILNGNYLARFEIISGVYTMETNYKQLPFKNQAEAISVNTDKIIVSSYDSDGGYILYWDGFQDGWVNILPTDIHTMALTHYQDGWLYILNGILFYTNGFSISEISKLPEAKRIGVNNNNPYHPIDFNGLKVYNGILYSAISYDNSSNISPAVYVFDFKYGWSKVPILKGGRFFGTPYSIFIEKLTQSSISYSEEILIGGDGTLNNIDTDRPSYTANKSKSYKLLIPTNQVIKVKAIGINLGYKVSEYLNALSTDKQTKISVNVGDGKFGYIGKAETTSFGYGINGFTLPGTGIVPTYKGLRVGDEIQILDGNSSGDRTYISNIIDTSVSVLPLLSTSDISSSHFFKIIKVKEAETKTINYDETGEEIVFYFNKAFQSNKLLLEIVIHGIANSFPISIFNINIYGNQ